jgi:hypothetical protein
MKSQVEPTYTPMPDDWQGLDEDIHHAAGQTKDE